MAKLIIVTSDMAHGLFFINTLRAANPDAEIEYLNPSQRDVKVDDVRGKVVYGNNLPLFLAAAAAAVGVIEFTNDHYGFNFVMPGLTYDELVNLGARIRIYSVCNELPLSWGPAS